MGWLTGDDPNRQFQQYVQPQIAQQRADWQNYQRQIQSLMGGYDWRAPQVTTQQSTTRTDQTQRPETTPEYMNLDALARGILERRLGAGGSLPAGYGVTGAQEISRAYDAAKTQAANVAAAHGLSGQQAVAAATPIAVAQAGELGKFRSNLPLLERQMTTEDLAAEAQRQAQFGTAQHTTGTSTMAGTTTAPANIEALLQYLQMAYAPYQTPIVSPGQRQGALGQVLQFGTGLIPFGSRGGSSPMTMPGPNVLNYGSPGYPGYTYRG